MPDVGSSNANLIKVETIVETQLVCKIRITNPGKAHAADQLKLTALLYQSLRDWR